MKYNRRTLSIITLLLAILTVLLLGPFYETDDEGLYKIVFHHLNELQNYYLLHHTFTKFLYGFLYNVSATFPWYDCLNYGAFMVAIFNLQKIFNDDVMPLEDDKPGKLLLTLLFTIALFYWHLVSFNYLRLTLLLAGSSTYLLMKYLLTQKKISAGVIYQIVLLFLAANTRIEGALFAILITAPVPLMLYGKSQFKKIAATLSIIIIIILPVLIADKVRDSKPEYAESVAREKYIYNMFEGMYINANVQLSNGLDSLRMEAVQRFFIADAEGVPLTFLKKLFNREVISISNLIDYKRNFGKVKAVIVLLFSKALLGFILLTLVYFVAKHRLLPILTLLYVTAVIMLLMAIGWMFKPEVRLIEPSTGLVLLFVLALLTNKIKNGKHYNNYELGSMLTVLLLFTLVVQRPTYLYIKEDAENRGRFMEELKADFKDNYLYLDAFYYHYALSLPFQEFPFGTNIKLVTIDIPYINIPWQTYNVCPSKNYESFLKCWKKNPSAVYISGEEHVDFIKRYAKVIYGMDMRFTKSSKQPAAWARNNQIEKTDPEKLYHYYYLEPE